jgi:hypothetical protein
MGRRMQVLSRWVREFAAGVDAGNAIRLGLPVRAEVRRDSVMPVASAGDGHAGPESGSESGSERPADAPQPAPASLRRRRDHAAGHAVAATAVPRRYRRVPTIREKA